MVQGQVVGRTRRLFEDGRSVVNLKLLCGDEIHLVQWWDLDPKEAPQMGEEVSLAVRVRAFTSKSGPQYALTVTAVAEKSESF
jgi:hypothetical protein